MSFEAEVSRLNILLEFFARCASVPDLDGLLRVVAAQLRWVIDFDGWGLALMQDSEQCWASTTLEPDPRRLDPSELANGQWQLLQRVVASGVTETQRQQPYTLAVPLQSGGRAIGAISLVRARGAYTSSDVRLMHHVAGYLGTLCARMHLESETRQLNDRKDEVLALLGHELRNPLAPILTAVELLKSAWTWACVP